MCLDVKFVVLLSKASSSGLTRGSDVVVLIDR
jgi:hypothetical protein